MKSSRFCARTCRLATNIFSITSPISLQQAHAADERYTARDGINMARFAMKLMHGEAERGAKPDRGESLKTAIVQTLGEEALRYVPRS